MKKYPKYKDSGVKWIGEIPEQWEVSKPKYETLKPVRYGLNISSDTYKEEGVRFIRITDITESGELSDNDSPKYLNRTDVPTEFLLNKFDLLLCRSGHTVGKSYFHQVDGEYTSGGYLVRFNFGNYDFSKYFIYITKSDFYWDWIKLSTIVSTIENVNGEKYSNFDFPLPSLPEQSQIVDFLDHKTTIIDDLIQKKYRKIELLKEHRTSIINNTVTKGLNPDVKMKDSGLEWIGEIPEHWLCVLIRHYYRKIGSGVTPRGGSEVYVENGITFIRSQNVLFEGLRLDDVVKITPETHLQMSGSKVNKGDLLLNITGGSIGRCCVVDTDGEMNVNQHVCIIRTKDSLTPVILNYFLQSDTGQKQLEFFITGGNREGLTGDSIKNFRVPLPPLPEQHQIVQYLVQKTNEIDTTISLENKKIDLLKEFRQSLISEVVTGKIDVRKN